MSFTPLGDTLHEKMDKNNPLKKQLEDTSVLLVTEEVLKDMFKEPLCLNAKPLFLKNRTLTISCTSSAMAQEIRIHQHEIVEKINEKLGTNEVDRIRYLA